MKLLDDIKAKRIETYSSMTVKDSGYLSVQVYENLIDGILLSANADIFDKSGDILVNYKLNNTYRFKSLIKKGEYSGRDFYHIMNTHSKEIPIIKSNNGNPFNINLNIGKKTIGLGFDSNKLAAIKDGRVEVYPFNKGNINWGDILEIYQINDDGYVYIDLSKKTRRYERLYLDGNGAYAFTLRSIKKLSGEVYLDFTPKKIKWKVYEDDFGERFKITHEFTISYDRNGIVNSLYHWNDGNLAERPLYAYNNDKTGKCTYSFHPVVFDPFKLNNFKINSLNCWVLETKKKDYGYDIYDREVFWIEDVDMMADLIDDLELTE